MAAQAEKRRFIVETHIGPEPTFATSAAKAINNVRFRIFGSSRNNDIVKYWTAREAS